MYVCMCVDFRFIESPLRSDSAEWREVAKYVAQSNSTDSDRFGSSVALPLGLDLAGFDGIFEPFLVEVGRHGRGRGLLGRFGEGECASKAKKRVRWSARAAPRYIYTRRRCLDLELEGVRMGLRASLSRKKSRERGGFRPF